MPNDAPLLPPVRVIHERLTRNQRERRLLRTLLRLALRDNEDQLGLAEKPSCSQRQGVANG